MKKKRKVSTKITIADYIKAVKKADRDIEIGQSDGWLRMTSIHKSKKVYDRKKVKDNFGEA